MNLQPFFDKHERLALQFSGGKDSLACLYLLKPWWDRLIVIWTNPGDPFPETLELIEKVKGLVSEFHEVKGNSYGSSSFAFPVDTLPVRATSVGRQVEPDGAKVTLRSRWDCCWQNFWLPMTQKVKELGVTIIFRGQRNSETLRAPIKEGSRDPSGAEIVLPINDWSADQVFAFLKEQGVEIPRFYEFMNASPDCMRCTAFSDDQRGKYKYLAKYHPKVAEEYALRIRLIARELQEGVNEMQRNLDEIQC